MTGSWFEAHPELAEEIRQDLLTAYPSLHLVLAPGAPAEIVGTFPVRDREDAERDRFRVRLVFPEDYPTRLPVVYEVGGRIPRTRDRHINEDGSACLFVPEDKETHFPKGAPFRQFLDGPVRSYFLSQALVERGEPWPFGARAHFGEGRKEFYRDALGTTDDRVVFRTVYLLAQPLINPRCDCVCGSGRKLRDCCVDKVRGLRDRVPQEVAKSAMREFGIANALYKGRRLR